jgi:hypothetical protein
MRPRRHFLSANWPFWLLIAAWFCANVPSTAILHTFVWVNGAKHFSHHSELRQNVVSLLTGKSHTTSEYLAATSTTTHPLPVSLPVDGTVKKIDLSLTPATLQLVATRAAVDRIDFSVRAPAAPVADVPYPPPRVRGQA